MAKITRMAAGHDYDEVVKSLAASTSEQPPEKRVDFLKSACAGNSALFDDVYSRLQHLLQTEDTRDVVRVSTPGFPPGTVLADRFRIVRQVGAGGMGMVYEAIDQTLDRRVAVKFPTAGHQTNLPPEARTAREVSHYNVCKVYDLHTAATDSGELNFLSMEFVEGENLFERIQRDGPLKPGEALEMARQICAGLAQAHRQSVIHGDLKLSNVILAKAPGGGTRAVITDFGLARFAEADGSSIRSGQGGTVDYMSPELLMGHSATVASDVYALGVMFHAMLTGRFPKRTSSGNAGLRQPSVQTRSTGPDEDTVTMGPRIVKAEWLRQTEELPRPWRQVIGKCLEPMPETRYRTVEAVAQALEPRRTTWKWAIAAALMLAAAFGYWQWQAPPAGPKVRLAVLPFRGDSALTAEISPVAVEIADRLSGAGRNFSVISPLDAQQNQVDTPEKARTILGATHVLETRISAAGGRLAAEARLLDVESGKALQTLQSSYLSGDTSTLARALIGTVTLGLNLKPRLPRKPVADAAYPAYTQGLSMLRQDPRRAGDAIPLLEKAIALDSRSALPYTALALAQVQRFRNGDGPHWLEQAASTVEKAAGIDPDSVQVLLAAGLVEQAKGRYEEAVQALRRATTFDPGNPSLWRVLAETYSLAGRDRDALETHRKAVSVDPGSYLPYLFFGNFYLARSQYPQAEEMYRKVTVLAPGLSSGHMNLGLALKQQGRYPEAEQSLLKALALRPSARLLANIGALNYEEERYQDALRFFQESEKQGEPAAALYRNLGDAYRHLARPRDAAEAYRAARAKSEEEVTTNPRSAVPRVRLALVSARLGDAHRAEFELSQALATEPGNTAVTSDVVQACEVLKQRDKSIEVLRQSPKYVLDEISRQPDLKELRNDPRFQQLLQKP